MTIARYTIGFILSLVLTIVAYYYVVARGDNPLLLIVLAILAIVQMIVQLVFFLHLGEEAAPRYKLSSFIFMAVVLGIVVIGSLWIMVNLNQNMMHMSPNEKTNYMTSRNDQAF